MSDDVIDDNVVSDIYVQMVVDGLVFDSQAQAPVVLLKSEEGDTVPIWLGAMEATSIACIVKKLPIPRPFAHDLIISILREVEAKVLRVVVTALKDSVYYAELVLSVQSGEKKIDARSSDAIAVALREGTPIYVHRDVIIQARMVSQAIEPIGTVLKSENFSEESSFNLIDKSRWSDVLDGLTPTDFKFKM